MTQDELKSNLHYDPITGNFTWAKTNGRYLKGTPAGYLHAQRGGYINIGFMGKNCKAHRLAFLYMLGKIPKQVDHIDHDRSNNSWSNLRAADATINSRNCSKSKLNKSGITGVSWAKSKNKWVAQISNRGKAVYLGRFTNIDDAIKARKKAEIEYNYHPNNGETLGSTPEYKKQTVTEYNLESVVKPCLDKFLMGTSLSDLKKEYGVSRRLITWMRDLACELGIADKFTLMHSLNKHKISKTRGKQISKPVHQLDLEGNILHTYPSVIKAANTTGVHQGSISNVISGRCNTSGGYRWEFA